MQAFREDAEGAGTRFLFNTRVLGADVIGGYCDVTPRGVSFVAGAN